MALGGSALPTPSLTGTTLRGWQWNALCLLKFHNSSDQLRPTCQLGRPRLEAKDGHAGVCLWSWVLGWSALLGSGGGKPMSVPREPLRGWQGHRALSSPEPQATPCPTLSPFWHPERMIASKIYSVKGSSSRWQDLRVSRPPLEGSWSERSLRP